MDTRSSVDVWSSEMSHFEKQQKSTRSSPVPPLRLCFPSPPSLCASPSPSLFFLGTCGVGNVLEREGGLECWTCSTCRLESWSRVGPTAHTRGEEERTDGRTGGTTGPDQGGRGTDREEGGVFTFFLSLMEPFPRTMILQPVSDSSCLAVSPRGPRILPTKLNYNTHTHTG